jgi:glycosyltransferase involved in cell wall biosynthesis
LNILVPTFSFPDPSIGSYDGRFVLSEAVGYALNGAAVLVVTPHYPGAARDEIAAAGVRVRRFRYFLPEGLQRLRVPGKPLYRVGSLLAALQAPFLLAALLVTIVRFARWADVIHAQWTPTGLLALPAKWLFGTKLVVTARGSDLRLLPRWANRFLHRRVDAAIDCFGPQPWNQAYKRLFPARYLTLPLLVDTGGDRAHGAPELEAAARAPDRPLILLYLGRFDRIKTAQNRLPLFELVEAAAILKAAGCPCRVFYLGSGEREIEERLRRVIAARDLADRVALLGGRCDVVPYVRACHLGVGGIALNGAAQDFAANARPQLLVDTPENAGTPWRDGVNALFVEPEDPAALAERIQWASARREELAQIGMRARDGLSRYITSAERGGRLYLDAFSALGEGRPPRRG